jgi:hypothetical protein
VGFYLEPFCKAQTIARLNNFVFGNLFISWEVEAKVVFESASFTRLPVTQSESKRVKRSSAVPTSPL